jgi:hypothetical protein
MAALDELELELLDEVLIAAELELIADEPELIAVEPELIAELEELLEPPPELSPVPLSSPEDMPASTPEASMPTLTLPSEPAPPSALVPASAPAPPSTPESTSVSPDEKDPHPPPTAPSSITHGTSAERVFIIATSPMDRLYKARRPDASPTCQRDAPRPEVAGECSSAPLVPYERTLRTADGSADRALSLSPLG